MLGRPVGGVGEADHVEGGGDPGREGVAGEAEVGRAEGDVVGHGGQEELVVGVLEHEADPAADLGQVGVDHGQAGDVDGRPPWRGRGRR